MYSTILQAGVIILLIVVGLGHSVEQPSTTSTIADMKSQLARRAKSMMGSATSLFSLSTRPKKDLCSDPDFKKLVEEKSVNVKVTPLITGKVYQEVFKQKSLESTQNNQPPTDSTTVVGSLRPRTCSLVKFTENKKKISMYRENIYTGNLKYPYTENWEETKNGVFKGETVPGSGGFAYNEDIYFLYADENALAFLTCPENTDLWRLSITVLKGKMEDKLGKTSVANAKKAVKALEAYIGKNQLRPLSQKNCPEHF